MGRLQNKILQKPKHPTSPTWLPYYRSTVFPTQIFRDLLIDCASCQAYNVCVIMASCER
jgi:hypothetical protein